MDNSLQLVVTLLAAAVVAVALFRRLRLPPMLGYLLVGIGIGPNALGLIPQSEQAQRLGDFGVVFLMFSIGLEFSLPQLVAMRRTVLGFGSAQVLATMLVVFVLAWVLGLSWQAGVSLGGIVAMSSTAIVAKTLSDSRELHLAHGRQSMGVLLFQDLAVVPLLILIPALAQGPEKLPATIGIALIKAGVVLSILLWFGRRLLRAWFHLVARQKSSEIFVLNVLLATLGLALMTQLAGLSLVLGAFTAGVLISETEYRYQVEDYIKPFRDVLLGLFFVTIGMLLNLGALIEEVVWVATVFAGVLVLKMTLIWALARFFGSGSAVATRVALALGTAGEFGFVLLQQAGSHGVIEPRVLQIVLAASVMSMLATPFLLAHADRIVLRFCQGEWLDRALALHELSVKAMATQNQVIVCGYGRSGQSLVRFLEQERVPIIALDSDPERVRAAAAAGESVVFGDAGRREVLIAAGIARAAALVVSFADAETALKILAHIQELRPGLPVIVRTSDDSDLERLKHAGAAEVVPEILEGSLMLASHAMLLLGVPLARVLKHIREMRRERYHLMRGFFHGVTDLEADLEDHSQPRLQSVFLTGEANGIGKTLGELGLDQLQVEVTAVRRRNLRELAPGTGTRLEPNDVVVLMGAPENLALAEEKLLEG
jgi:monovalent cation:H+ antiporter-2, CPA2 family